MRKIIIPEAIADKIPKGMTGPMFDCTYKSFRTQWSHYCKRVGVNFTPHQLRHAYASMLYDAGIGVKDAQNLLGHSDVSTTQNIYTHIMQARNEQTAKQLNAYFNKMTENAE